VARGDLEVVVASPEAAEQVALYVRAAAEQAASIVREQASSSTVAAEPAESAAGTVANATVLQRSDGSRYYAPAMLIAFVLSDVGNGGHQQTDVRGVPLQKMPRTESGEVE
jgi:hypothetical protein